MQKGESEGRGMCAARLKLPQRMPRMVLLVGSKVGQEEGLLDFVRRIETKISKSRKEWFFAVREFVISHAIISLFYIIVR